MAPKCNACGKFLSAADKVTCTKCSGTHHRACVTMPQGSQTPAAWLCPSGQSCKASLPRANTDGTPIKGQPHTSSSTDSAVDTADVNLIQKFREEVKKASEECKIWREEVADIRSIMNSMADRLEKLEKRVEDIEQLRSSAVGVEGEANKALEVAVFQLKCELDERDQELLLNNVDIAGIPEEDNESVQHLVLACATKLGVPLDDRDIVSCRRVGLQVRLARRSTRDQLIKAARVRRGLNTEGLGLRAPPRLIYLNERLTRTNRQIFNKAREIAKKLSWRFVWTREGQVFIRRDHGAPASRIRSCGELERVFGKEAVCL
ncbi:hypothetical protein ABMA27_010467 [Loxostege sticticalis]|uniref:FP protein C-terminal domain-containing protein n=1 Tax=Loxostege sticticalis TaxID=481309 RepID=A0ABR3H6E9_LOXSC